MATERIKERYYLCFHFRAYQFINSSTQFFFTAPFTHLPDPHYSRAQYGEKVARHLSYGDAFSTLQERVAGTTPLLLPALRCLYQRMQHIFRRGGHGCV